MTDVIDIADDLRTRSPERLWGLSAESLYSALAGKATDASIRNRLNPHVRAETLRTNDERDGDRVLAIHEWLLDRLDLVADGAVTLLGMVVLTSEQPQPLIRAITVARFQPAEMVLRSCEETGGNIPRRELDSLLADGWDETVLAPLLGSLGFMVIYPDSVDLEEGRIDAALSAQQSVSTDSAIVEAYLKVLPHIVDPVDQTCLEDLTIRISGKTPTERPPETAAVARLASSGARLVDDEELKDAVRDQRREYEEHLDTVRSLLIPSRSVELKQVETDGPVTLDDVPQDSPLSDDGRELLLDLVATVVTHPDLETIDMNFVTELRSDITPYALYQALSSISGVNCEVSDGMIEFRSVPAAVDGRDLREEYTTYLVDWCSAIKSRIDSLSDASVSIPPDPVAAESIINRDYESLNDGDVAPAYFTYTLVDPEALGERKMDDYVGGSRGLGRERARLRRWHEERPSGLRSYTAMTDRLFGHGLERDIEDKMLRVMTPFDDDTFNEYVSQIRRLLEHGFELRLLTRHTKEPWEWRRLQRNLLSEIKEHRDQVTVRTYSRFKEHQRVTPDADFRELGELGIHGKLQTIGAPEEGAALLGSANFMENSYDWNPECGVYTERTQFVDAAIEFFDIVWDISASDELSIERLQEISERQLIPTYYS